jgi:hypothetical protein
MSFTQYFPPPTFANAPFVAFGYSDSAGVLLEAGIYTPGGFFTSNPLVEANIIDSSQTWVAEYPTTPGPGTYDLCYLFLDSASGTEELFTVSLTLTTAMTAAVSGIVYPTSGMTVPSNNLVAFGTITAGALLGVIQISRGAPAIPPDVALVRGGRWLARWKALAAGAATLTVQAIGEASNHTANLTVAAMFREAEGLECRPGNL